MNHLGRLHWAAFALVALLGAASAQAGTVTGATGPFVVNGKSVTLSPGQSLATKPDDRIDTANAKVTYRSDTGDEVVLDEGTNAREFPTTQVAAGLFLSRGSATGSISEKTQLGVAAGWATGRGAKRAKVYVEASPGREATEALFRAVEGDAGISYQSFAVLLSQAHSVTLDIDPALPGALCFRTGQGNPGSVEFQKTVPGGTIVVLVPKATMGCFSDEKGNKTKICNDINSLKTAKIHITTHFVGKSKNDADIGPGTCALIDNATGAIEVLFTAVEFEILERAISLTSEFATLTQSNFSDVK